MKKATILKAAAGILAALAVCTVASRSIDTLLMPQVSLLRTSSGTLDYNFFYTGAYGGAENATEVLAKDSWTITQTLVEEGRQVAEGDALYKVDVSSYQIQLKQMEADIQRQTNALNATDWSGGDRLVYEQQLQAARMQYDQLKAKVPSGGVVRAPAAGRVTGVIKPGMVNYGSVLAVVEGAAGQDAETNAQVRWTMPLADAEHLLSGKGAITCSYSVLDESKNKVALKQIAAKAKVASVEYDEAAANYQIVATLEEGAVLPRAGQKVSVAIRVLSDSYATLVPLACLNHDGERDFVYTIREENGLWGVERRLVRTSVTVVASNYQYAAVEGPLYGESLAAYPTKAVQKDDAVRVKGQ